MKSLTYLLLLLGIFSLSISCSREDDYNLKKNIHHKPDKERDYSFYKMLEKNSKLSTNRYADRVNMEDFIKLSIPTNKGGLPYPSNSNFTERIKSSTIGAPDHLKGRLGYYNPDKIYKIDIDTRIDVELRLLNLQNDLDLFLTRSEKDNNGKETIGKLLHLSTNIGVEDEKLEVTLDSGTYFIVVDTYKVPSDFLLYVKSTSKDSELVSCNNFNHLSDKIATRGGINSQSIQWRIWDYPAQDAAIIAETDNANNKIIDLNYHQHGYQDVIRTIGKNPIVSGKHSIDFKIKIPENKEAKIRSDKSKGTGRHTSNQGFEIHFKQNGLISIKQDGLTMVSMNTFDHNEWIEVHMEIDFDKDIIQIYLDDLIQAKLSAALSLEEEGNIMSSFYGLNFFVVSEKQAFSLDDFCLKIKHLMLNDDLKPDIAHQPKEILDFIL